MPLVVSTLQSELVSIYTSGGDKGNPDPKKVGRDVAGAYFNYVSAGVDSGGSSFAGMPGKDTLGQKLGGIYGKEYTSGLLHAQDMAKEFDACLQTFKTAWQTVIVTTAGTMPLFSGLNGIFSSPNSDKAMFARKFGMELANFTMMAMVSGLIPGSPPVPYTGPIN
jgi:hypothetical protein